jgi:Tfp pilus assembly protein PilF
MKKHRRVRRRPKHHAHAPKKGSSSSGSSGGGLQWLGWLGGIGVLALIAYLVLQSHRPPINSAGREMAGNTNNSGAEPVFGGTQSPVAGFAAPNGNGGAVGSIPGRTNRPGAALNREAEGHADDLNDQGTRFLEAGDPKKAAELFAKAIKLAPENETLHFNLGVAYVRAGDVTNAEREYKEALRLVPDYPEANNNYGNLLARENRLAEAKVHFSSAVEDMPESAEYNNSLGVLRERLKETNEALASFQKAVECDSNYMEAHFNVAQSYLSRKNQEKAIAELREVLRIKPGFDPAVRLLGYLTNQSTPAAK